MPVNRINSFHLMSAAITSADANTTKPVLDIPAKTYVKKVWIVVDVLFAGGTPSIDIGDGTDVDGWIDSTDITEATVGAYSGDGGDAVWSFFGKYYQTADTIDAVIATGLTSGNAFVIAECFDLSGLAT